MEVPVMLEGGRRCRLALRQRFRQAEEVEDARFLGRGEVFVGAEEVRIFCRFWGKDAPAPQEIRFPLGDPSSVAVESGGSRLYFAGTETGTATSPAPLRLTVPGGELFLLFWPLSVENGMDPAALRGTLTLRYRLTDAGGLLREAELRYTLLGEV